MNKEVMNEAAKIIDAIGGNAKVAELCEVGVPAVCNWRARGIPPARLIILKAKRPKVFAALARDAGKVPA